MRDFCRKLLYQKLCSNKIVMKYTASVKAPGERVDLSCQLRNFAEIFDEVKNPSLGILKKSCRRSPEGCVTQDTFVRTGLEAGSLNKRYAPNGYQLALLAPLLFYASFMPYRGIAPKCMRFLHWIFYKYFPMSSASIT